MKTEKEIEAEIKRWEEEEIRGKYKPAECYHYAQALKWVLDRV